MDAFAQWNYCSSFVSPLSGGFEISEMRVVRSLLVVASWLPSGLKASPAMGIVWSVNSPRSFQPSASHNFTRPS